MSRKCAICGKTHMTGNSRSNSNIATKRTFGVNIQKATVDIDGKVSREYVCTKCKKTSKKNA